MQWSRGLFRFWILFAALWVIGAVIVNYGQIANPYMRKGGYIFGSDLTKPPIFAEEYSDPYNDAVDLKTAKKAIQYEVGREGEMTDSYFFPSSVSQEDAIKIFDSHAQAAAAKQTERIAEARRDNIITAIAGAVIPPIIILILGIAIRWALMGFRKSPPQT